MPLELHIVNHSKKNKTETQLVDSVAKALGILDCFATDRSELSLNQLCDKTGLYKSRVHRLCGTLMATGYLIKTSRSNYRLGPKLMVLGKVYEKTNSLRTIAAPFMRQLSATTKQSTALFVLDGAQCICMAREVGSARLVYSISEGDNMNLVSTASGRALLAFADDHFTDNVLEEALNSGQLADTENAIATIKEQLTHIRQAGFAINLKGIEEGVGAVAAPVFDFDHNVAAALAIVGPAQRFTDDQCDELIESLLEATTEISRLMGES